MSYFKDLDIEQQDLVWKEQCSQRASAGSACGACTYSTPGDSPELQASFLGAAEDDVLFVQQEGSVRIMELIRDVTPESASEKPHAC